MPEFVNKKVITVHSIFIPNRFRQLPLTVQSRLVQSYTPVSKYLMCGIFSLGNQ